jgi:signal transduction histidine kinase
MDGAYGGSRKAPALGAEIALTDDGEGIPEELFDKIMDPFFTTKESDSGSGFGLYNAKLYVEDHKGLLGFRSIIGSGTTFYIFLPLTEDENASESSRKRAARRATREFVKPRKRKG